MSGFLGKSIITDGLILCLDSDNERSYSGDGNLWKDISGYGNNITLLNIGTYIQQAAPINYLDNGTYELFKLTPLNGYSAGTTQDINFSLDAYFDDLSSSRSTREYGDFFSITFPEGFIINSASLKIGYDETPGEITGVAEELNGITNGGRTVSWGDNDNIYGGIINTFAFGTHAVQVNVTINRYVTGPQTLNCVISGDGFDINPHLGFYDGYSILYPNITQQNGAIKFDGINDYALGIYNSSLNLSTNNFTIEACFNSESFSTGQVIISNDTWGSNYDWSLYIQNSTSISIYSNATTTNVTATVPNMAINQWYKVTISSISGVIRIYLNGVLYKTKSMSISNDSQSYYTIGCSGWNNQNSFFKGKLSIIRMYNRGLTDSEVLYNFNVIKNRFSIEINGGQI